MTNIFRAIKSGDLYYLVVSDVSQSDDDSDIIITEEDYSEMLKNNQEKGWMVRAYTREDGSLYVKSVEQHQPNIYSVWDVKTGSWVEDSHLKEKYLKSEYVAKCDSELDWVIHELNYLQDLIDIGEEYNGIQADILALKKYKVAIERIKRADDYPNIEVVTPPRPELLQG